LPRLGVLKSRKFFEKKRRSDARGSSPGRGFVAKDAKKKKERVINVQRPAPDSENGTGARPTAKQFPGEAPKSKDLQNQCVNLKKHVPAMLGQAKKGHDVQYAQKTLKPNKNEIQKPPEKSRHKRNNYGTRLWAGGRVPKICRLEDYRLYRTKGHLLCKRKGRSGEPNDRYGRSIKKGKSQRTGKLQGDWINNRWQYPRPEKQKTKQRMGESGSLVGGRGGGFTKRKKKALNKLRKRAHERCGFRVLNTGVI